MCTFLIVSSCRENERQHQRIELWNRVENMAARSPGYDLLIGQTINVNNISNSPDQDEELTLEIFEKETLEVCLFSHYEHLILQ